MQWLRDTYNGVFGVLIRPNLPSRGAMIGIVVGVLLGLLWAYAIQPTIFYDADPLTLQQTWQDEWVKLLADRNVNATSDVAGSTQQLLGAIDDPLGVVDSLLVRPGEEANVARLQAIRPLAEAAQPTAPVAPQPNIIGNILPFILAPIVLLIIASIIVVVWNLLIKPALIDPLLQRSRGQRTNPEVAAVRQQVAAARQAEATQRTDFATTTLGKPVIQRMSTYLLGRGTYDDSFSIETESGTFYGECGAGIAEGDDDAVQAVEVWMFDKDDIVTLTKVFASAYAFNDPATRARLNPKGEVVLAQPGATLVLESNALRLQARVVSVEYAPAGANPANSIFQQITIELAAWHKAGATAVAPATVSSTPTASIPAAMPVAAAPTARPVVAPATFAPPASAPATQPVVVASPGTPLVIPPSQPTSPYAPPAPGGSRTLDDDPFGGTGDFTPLR